MANISLELISFKLTTTEMGSHQLDEVTEAGYSIKNENNGNEIESSFNWVIDQTMNGGRISLIQLAAPL